jgi:hypothetical protein
MQAEVLILDRVRLYDKTYRIIPSQFPPIALFESCADPKDLEALFFLESLTNDRLRQEAGVLSRVPEEDRVSGPGTTVIMASFTHTGMASRFTDGSFGVYYAGLELETAIAESKHWQAKQIADTESEKPLSRTMRVYTANINGKLSDLVDLRKNNEVHDLNSYSESQRLGHAVRNANEYGLVYNSVRNADGLCVAAFRPPIIMQTTQAMHLRYCWNGDKIDHVEQISNV